jgi:hypothetical protein
MKSGVQIRPHHQRAIERLVERFSDDLRFPAVIVGGSVAKGIARDDSDVDAVFIASDEEWRRRRAGRDYFMYLPDLCDYPHGYVDAKVVDKQFLLDAADHGSEPARFAFRDAFVAYSRIPGLEEVVQRIPVYPEHERVAKLKAFYSHVVLYAQYFMPEAERWENEYLRWHAATNLVLFAGRLILAHNRILYASQKWLLKAVAEAPEKPAELLPLLERVIAQPSSAAAAAVWECLREFRDWGMTPEQIGGEYICIAEWGWREGRPGTGPVEW